MNRLFDQTMSRSHPEQEMVEGSWTPPVDIYEAQDRVVLRADIPGMKQEEIDIRVENNVLLIRGERRLDPSQKREEFLRIERPLGTFSRSFSLPPTADQGRISAEYRNGVLEVTLAKRVEAQARSVKVAVQS
jgi:HSP20 family protein